MIEQLFGSKTRVKLLQLFYTNANRSFYVREITRKIDEQINSVRRELSNLLTIGIITSDANNNKLYYEVNQDYQHYKALSMMFGGVSAADKETKKTAHKASDKQNADVPSEHPIAKSVRGIGHVELAVLTGQFTRDESSGVDLLIVGDVNKAKVANFIAELEQTENKELRYTILSLDNYKYRQQINDRFLNNVLGSKKQIVINTQEIKI